MGLEILIEENAVAVLARTALEGKRDEIAEAAFRHGVLTREEAVIGSEPDIRVSLHRLGQQKRSEAAREGGGHRLGEDDPDMPAIARTRPFQGTAGTSFDRQASRKALASRRQLVSVEIGGDKSAAVVRQHGIDADRVAPTQMPVDRFVRHLPECLVE